MWQVMRESCLMNAPVRTVIGIDYGLKRIGIAVGNTLTQHAERALPDHRADPALHRRAGRQGRRTSSHSAFRAIPMACCMK